MIPIVIPYPVSIEKKDVNFYDYDGTLLYSYTTAQAQALSALPPAPNHSADEVPLTFQEWNHTLAQVNATTSVLDVGATYIPTDGKTHFIIRVTAVTGGSVPFYFTKSNATDTLSIDYGDGQTDSNSADANVTFTPATALAIGDHEVTVWLSSGEGTYSLGQGSNTTTVVGGATQNYRSTLLRCYIGENSFIATASFLVCNNLLRVSIPKGVISVGNQVFASCESLIFVVFPSSVLMDTGTTFRDDRSLIGAIFPDNAIEFKTGQSFYNCPSLASIILPINGTLHPVVPGSVDMFNGCTNLKSIIVPKWVTNVRNGMFSNCPEMLEYDFSNFTSVPTIGGPLVSFTHINPLCVMKIPAALYAEWSTATNWSTYAAYMVAV